MSTIVKNNQKFQAWFDSSEFKQMEDTDVLFAAFWKDTPAELHTDNDENDEDDFQPIRRHRQQQQPSHLSLKRSIPPSSSKTISAKHHSIQSRQPLATIINGTVSSQNYFKESTSNAVLWVLMDSDFEEPRPKKSVQHSNLYPAVSKVKVNEDVSSSKNGIKAGKVNEEQEAILLKMPFFSDSRKTKRHLVIESSSSTSVHKSASLQSASSINKNHFTSNRSFNGSFGATIHSNFNVPFTTKSNKFVVDADAEDEAMESAQIIFDVESAEDASTTKKPTTNGYKTHSEIEIEVGLDSGNEFEEIIEDDKESESSSSESEDVPVPKRRRTVSGISTAPVVVSDTRRMWTTASVRLTHILRANNGTIDEDWTNLEIDEQARKIITAKIRPILERNSVSYGSTITAQQLYNAGFQRMMLYEQRNWLNMAALEKRIQQILAIAMKVPIGRRLFRDYYGGRKPAPDGEHMRYGVYSLTG
ncbi:UNVERIFIED_CONTAM: hypothetical protein HDU68_009999, partial [Siphonaria sp. JEL0065]